MKYLRKRNNTYYYRRRIPLSISELSTVNIIRRSLSKDLNLAKQLADRYDKLFNMIDLGIKLKQDISDLIDELGLPAMKQIDIYRSYLESQNVSSKRLTKLTNLMNTLQALLPKDISTIDMKKLDVVKRNLLNLPKGNIQKYKSIPKIKLVSMTFKDDEKLSTETVNDYIKTLNALLKFGYERDVISRSYMVKTLASTVSARDQRTALEHTTIITMLEQARTDKLGSAYALLYLSGMRLSEAYKCKISMVDGVECFDLTDKSLELKTKSSHRLIPVHSSMVDPHKMLDDLQSFKIQNLSRQFKKDSNGESIYSLRHSFATRLASRVEPHIISELLGHTHSGMTLNRYVKGFDVKVLKEAVDKL